MEVSKKLRVQWEAEALQEQRFTEKDWKLFRSKIADWQESFMDRLNGEYIAILSEDANPSDKFWKLDKRIKEDRKKAGVQVIDVWNGCTVMQQMRENMDNYV